MTKLDLLTEFWAHHYAESNTSEEIEDDDFNLDRVLAEIEAEADAEPDDWENVDLDAKDRG